MSSIDIQSLSVTRHGHAISVVINPHAVYTFDPSGRLLMMHRRGRCFARSLSGQFKEKSWIGASDALDRSISEIHGLEKDALLRDASTDLREAEEYLDRESPRLLDGSLDRERAGRLIHGLRRRVACLPGDDERFHRVYKSVAILPPDQYFPVVVQLTEGCAWSRCTFCGFYRDRPFRARTLDEIQSHLREVREFLGAGASLRRSIFLADANAFCLSAKTLLAAMPRIAATFPHQMREGGIASFADLNAINVKTLPDLVRLRQAGLHRLYLGLETGHDPLRRWVRKLGTADDAVKAVKKAKIAGFEVTPIVMLGLGGRRFAEGHAKDTVETLRRMDLGERSIVYFSPFIPALGTAYATAAEKDGVEPLSRADMRRQFTDMRHALREAAPAATPRCAVYDIRETVY